MDIVSKVPVCCAPVGGICGEGVLWHPAEEAVYWADINRFHIHRLHPRDGTVRSWIFDEPVTAVLLTTSDDDLLVCLGSKTVFWRPRTDTRTDTGFRLKQWPKVRLNDAGVDPRGSLWAGTMRNNVRADGSETEAGGEDGVLLRIDPDGKVSQWADRIGISNTLVWSPDRRTFFFGDSLANAIWSFDYSEETGYVERIGKHLYGFERGLPDGSAMDTDGFLWNCRYGGSCIVRVSPQGTIDRVIEMPVSNITNCTFGGPNLDVLYITTAASKPGAPFERLGGSLFSLQTNVRGIPESKFTML
jgi:sugar lactone lactonase YvrE